MNYFPTLNQLWGDYPLTFSQMIHTDIAFGFLIWVLLALCIFVIGSMLNRHEWLSS